MTNTEHTCHLDARTLSPAQARDLCPRCTELAEAMSAAETMGRATGSVAATVRVERRELDGTLTVEHVETWTRPAGQTCGVCGQRFAGSHVEHYAAAHR